MHLTFLQNLYKILSLFYRLIKIKTFEMNKLCFLHTSFCFLTKTIYLRNFNIYTAYEPSLNKSVVKVSDQFTGQFGVFAKSSEGKSAYRFFVNKPFIRMPTSALGNLAMHNGENRSSYNGYFNWQFFGRKHISNGFFTCSFYEKNRVFNIGSRFMYNLCKTAPKPEQGFLVSHNIDVLGVDIFYNTPIGSAFKAKTFTFYNAWHHDLDSGCLNIGSVINPVAANTKYKRTKVLEGFENRRILSGTLKPYFYYLNLAAKYKYNHNLTIDPKN